MALLRDKDGRVFGMDETVEKDKFYESPLHGEDGWHLADYDWSEETGMARCTYRKNNDPIAHAIVNRSQMVSEEYHRRIRENWQEQPYEV